MDEPFQAQQEIHGYREGDIMAEKVRHKKKSSFKKRILSTLSSRLTHESSSLRFQPSSSKNHHVNF
jgi:hypothetical protein